MLRRRKRRFEQLEADREERMRKAEAELAGECSSSSDEEVYRPVVLKRRVFTDEEENEVEAENLEDAFSNLCYSSDEPGGTQPAQFREQSPPLPSDLSDNSCPPSTTGPAPARDASPEMPSSSGDNYDTAEDFAGDSAGEEPPVVDTSGEEPEVIAGKAVDAPTTSEGRSVRSPCVQYLTIRGASHDDLLYLMMHF